MSEFLVKDGQKFIFIGDSITDCDRCGANRAYGLGGTHGPYGFGYVKYVVDLVTARYPERKITFLNRGISGHTVKNLYDRWYDDVLIHKPDWVSVKIGINDLHRFLGKMPDAVSVEDFEKYYDKILGMLDKKTKILLIDPFYISREKNTDSFRRKVLNILPKYIAVVDKMAKKYKTLHVKTHNVFMNALKYRSADEFCEEPVHPIKRGHMVIAHEVLRALKW